MKREVKYKDGLPETLTLPQRNQFIYGWYTNNDSCGCVVGHALYAFGCDFEEDERGPVNGRVVLAEKFAAQVCAHAFGLRVVKLTPKEKYDTPYVLANGKTIDTWYAFDTRMERSLNKTREKVAHSWRVVAQQWGYDVTASEPGWKP